MRMDLESNLRQVPAAVFPVAVAASSLSICERYAGNGDSHSNIKGQEGHVRVIVVTDSNGRKRKLFVPATLDLDRPKRPRTAFTSKQLDILEMEFQQNHFITDVKRRSLALVLELSEIQIKVWFQNRRTKYRRSTSKEEFQSQPNTNSNTNTTGSSTKIFGNGTDKIKDPDPVALFSPSPSVCVWSSNHFSTTSTLDSSSTVCWPFPATAAM